MYCGKCGKKIEDNAVTCKWCGEPTGVELEDMKPEDMESENVEPEGMESEKIQPKAPKMHKTHENYKASEPASTSMGTKLGVAVGLLAAGVYWIGMGSELAALLLIAYIFLKEEDNWLRGNALKAGVIIVGFAVIQGMIGILSDGITSFKSLFSIVITFDYYNTPFDKLCSMLSAICSVAKNVILLIAGYQAFRYQNFRIGLLDRIVYNNMERK